MSFHGYEGVMSVLCTPLQVKCYQTNHIYLYKPTLTNLYSACLESVIFYSDV